MSHHQHNHSPSDYNRAFAIGVALNVIYIVVEASYGFLAGSLALLFLSGRKKDLNIRGAFLHMAADPESVKTCLFELPGVIGVHDLHIWGHEYIANGPYRAPCEAGYQR